MSRVNGHAPAGSEAVHRLSVTRRIEPDHPAFAGHFPGQPLLPGVLLLAEVMEAALQQPALAPNLGALNHAKFLAPVTPGSTLSITLDADASGCRFEVLCDGVPACKGQFTGRSES